MARDLRGTPKEQQFFALLKTVDLNNPTADFFDKAFAAHLDGPELFRPDDVIRIGPEHSRFVKPDSDTTIGIFIVNKFIFEMLEVFGYLNVEFGKVWKKLDAKVAEALVAGDITTEQFGEYIDRCQFLFGGTLAHIINPSLSSTIIKLPPAAKKQKKELMKENAEALAANDTEAASRVERAVTKTAVDEMRKAGDPAISIFDSGAVDPYNNMKTMLVMKGSVEDPTGESPTGYKVVTSDYNEGISKNDVPAIANAVVNSSYSSGVKTQDAGYIGKKYNVLMQRVTIGPKGSDCGTGDTMTAVVTSRFLHRFMLEGNKLVELTAENLDQYKGKRVRFRSPLHCKMKDPCYCNVCVGNRFYNLGINNVGLSMSVLSGSLLNASLQSKHNSVLSFYKLTSDDLMKYVN